MKIDKNVILCKQVENMLDIFYQNGTYTGYKRTQIYSTTIGDDYYFTDLKSGLSIEITDMIVHIKERYNILYAIPISGNYVCIQNKCKQMMSVAKIIKVEEHKTATGGDKYTVTSFEKK